MARPAFYQCDETYFSSITTESQAYILGFLWADGHVNTRSGVRVIIKEEDVGVLNFIQQEMRSSFPIKIRKRMGRRYADLSFNRLRIVKDLFALGITSNKSGQNCPIPIIKSRLIPFFLRGLFDGDGSIWRKGKRCWAASFAGGNDFLIWVKLQLAYNGIESSPIRQRHTGNDNSCMLDISGEKNILKLKSLFLTTGFMMTRKKLRLEDAYST